MGDMQPLYVIALAVCWWGCSWGGGWGVACVSVCLLVDEMYRVEVAPLAALVGLLGHCGKHFSDPTSVWHA